MRDHVVGVDAKSVSAGESAICAPPPIIEPPQGSGAFGCIRVQTVANGSGGAIATNSTLVIPFSRADRRGKIARVQIPDHCGNGHRLTVGNVRIDQRERRWRCRQCGNDRAAAFRDRQRTG